MITKNTPTHLPPTGHRRHVIIDFIAYARKVSIKKQNLKTYNDFFISLWSTFTLLFKSCNRIDIALNVYKENSIKASEQRRRTTVEGIETTINNHKEDDCMCVSFVNGLVRVERLLECTHKEADDEIFFHANQEIKIGNYGSVVIASPDSYICIRTASLLQTEVL